MSSATTTDAWAGLPMGADNYHFMKNKTADALNQDVAASMLAETVRQGTETQNQNAMRARRLMSGRAGTIKTGPQGIMDAPNVSKSILTGI